MTKDPRGSTVAERIAAIVGDDALSEDMEFTYSWTYGYETVYVKREGAGGFEFQGAFHPDGSCVGEGICRYCGRTLAHD